MRPSMQLFMSYLSRVASWASAGFKALAPVDTAPGYGEPDVTEDEDAVEMRVYAFIESHMMCEMYGLPGSVAVSEVGFARALDRAKATGKTVRVRLNSYGGDVFCGTTIANLIRENKLAVVVDGVAASIASVMAAASPHVTMLPGSTLMLHNPWGCVCGNAKGLRAEATVLDTIREAMLDIYTAKTDKRWSREQWVSTLDGIDGADGTWWTGEQALEAGMADAYQRSAPDAMRAQALLEARRDVATIHAVALPKNLGGEDLAVLAPETLAPAGPRESSETIKPSVRVSNRPGAFRIPR